MASRWPVMTINFFNPTAFRSNKMWKTIIDRQNTATSHTPHATRHTPHISCSLPLTVSVIVSFARFAIVSVSASVIVLVSDAVSLSQSLVQTQYVLTYEKCNIIPHYT